MRRSTYGAWVVRPRRVLGAAASATWRSGMDMRSTFGTLAHIRERWHELPTCAQCDLKAIERVAVELPGLELTLDLCHLHLERLVSGARLLRA